ncbi:SAM14 protein, partial [Cardinalis cardinalis]|nr:SAM14 protein [Cardinalis cardinalis]
GQRGSWCPSLQVTTPVPRVTLRRASSGKSRKEKSSNRLSMGSREAAEGPGRPSGSPFLPFSWFSDSARGSPGPASPAGSPRHEGLSPPKSASQVSPGHGDGPGDPMGPERGGDTSPGDRHKAPEGRDTPGRGLEAPRGQGGFVGVSEPWRDGPCGHPKEPRCGEAPGGARAQPAVPQALGVGSSQDRAVLKRRLKELSLAAERERRARDKA